MKVLYVCPDTGIDVLGRKGASVHVREMIAAFARAGHEVDLVAPRVVKPGAAPASVDARVIRVPVPDEVQQTKGRLDRWLTGFAAETSLPKDLRRMLYDEVLEAELDRRYGDDAPDLIYVRASLLSTAGVALARRTGAPLVVELNAPLADEQTRYRAGGLGSLYRSVEQTLLGAADLVAVVSEALLTDVVAAGVDPRRVRVVPNGVDPARFRPGRPTLEERRRLGIPDGPVLGFVGGLRPWHGVDRLPRVLAALGERHPTASLVIAGDGPQRAEIECEAERHGVRDRVVLLGAVDHHDMPSVIRSFDVALAPYPQLAHDFYFSPLKMFEYLGCGVPTVASDVGQIADLVRSGDEALLVPADDDAAIVRACAAVLDDPVAAAAMGRRGAELVHRSYTWDRNAAEALSVCAARA